MVPTDRPFRRDEQKCHMPGFFDTQKSIIESAAKTSASVKRNVFSVSQLTALITRALKAGLPAQVAVKGEVSNCKLYAGSGHTYFTLKDERDCIDCVLYKSDAARTDVRIADGMEIIVTGPVSVYGPRGRYQIKVLSLHLAGQGALELAFQRLKAALEAEGLFAPERKIPVPMYPTRIALVTSRQAAGMHDMLKVLRATPFVTLFLFHVPVQGEGAAVKIAEALDLLNAQQARVGGVDVILLGRGGGSLEDLWAFNEECVARAVARSRIPIVSGIGHEVDVSIADLAADHHAHTPTKAAEVVIQHWKQAIGRLEYAGTRMRTAMRNLLATSCQQLQALERQELFRRPMDQINFRRQLLDEKRSGLSSSISRRLTRAYRVLEQYQRRLDHASPSNVLRRRRHHLHEIEIRLRRAMWGFIQGRDRKVAQISARLLERHPRHLIQRRGDYVISLTHRLGQAVVGAMPRYRGRLDMLERHLNAVGPQQVLRRGYTMTLDKSGRVIRSASQIHPNDRLTTQFADGQVESTVRDAQQGELFE